jgi:hypothetical protein
MLAAAGRESDLRVRHALEADAHFRMAVHAERTGDADAAARHYTSAADAVDARAALPVGAGGAVSAQAEGDLVRLRRDAAHNAAILLERTGAHRAAAVAYRRAAALLVEPADRRIASFRAAEMLGRSGDRNGMVRDMRAFSAAHAREEGAGPLIVEARSRIADVLRTAAARGDVVAAFQASGEAPGSASAVLPAQARLANAEEDGRARLSGLAVRPTAAPTAQAWTQSLRTQIAGAAARSNAAIAGYEEVIALRSPHASVTALARQGDAEQMLARAILDSPFVLPRDVRAQIARLPRAHRGALVADIEATYRSRLEDEVRPVECRAIQRWLLAVRLARAANVDTSDTRHSLERLRAFGTERVAQCTEGTPLGPFGAGELTPPPAGFTRTPADRTSPPTLH